MSIKELQPREVWGIFYELTRIPRPSKRENRVVDYVKKTGEDRGLETIVDQTGNVIIKKPASPGMENRKGVILQGHLDMVPQKNSQVEHDFENDPIDAYVDGEWVTARGTTLGADNGIGVAAVLAVLKADNLEHGPVEALLTVDEETGMTGAFGLKPGLLDGDILINLDSEEHGQIYVGCAGGIEANILFTYQEEAAAEDVIYYKLQVSGLKGGHSGMDIVLGRGNSNKLLFRYLKHAAGEYGLRIVSVDGGGMRNAIPREAEAVVAVPESYAGKLEKSVKEFEKIFQNELGKVEPDLLFNIEKTDRFSTVIDEKTQRNLIYGIYACPNGVIRMSDSVADLVETSTNLASVKSQNGQIVAQCLLRSSVDSAKEDLANMIQSVFELAGADVSFGGSYPGWKPNVDSEILGIAKNVYEKLHSEPPKIKAVHAGLECGLLGGVYPEIDMISFGPTISHPHSPDEKVHIESVGKFWDYLLDTLKNIPVK